MTLAAQPVVRAQSDQDEWRDIPDWGGRYQISPAGRIRRVNKRPARELKRTPAYHPVKAFVSLCTSGRVVHVAVEDLLRAAYPEVNP